jgi:hypothetical protein
MYDITTPVGVVHRPPEGRCWSMIEPEFQKLYSEGRIYFGKDGKSQPSVIRYLSEVEGFVPWSWWPHEEVGHTDEARKEIQDVFKTQTADGVRNSETNAPARTRPANRDESRRLGPRFFCRQRDDGPRGLETQPGCSGSAPATLHSRRDGAEDCARGDARTGAALGRGLHEREG